MTVLMVFANFAFGQKATSANKAQLVNEIVEQTFSAFPLETLEAEIEKVKKESSEKFKIEIPELLISKVEENTEFSNERKEEIKAKVPAFGESFGNKVSEIITKDLNVNLWLKEALADDFTKNFTVAQLRKISSFMKGKNGKAFFEAVKAIAKNESKESIENKITDKQAIEIDKFMKSPVGKKFMNLFAKDTEIFLAAKIETWSAQMLKNIDEAMETGELGEMLKQFIIENFS